MRKTRCHDAGDPASRGTGQENARVTLTVRSGPWPAAEIEAYLASATIPVRLASNGRTYPLVQSLWFRYEKGALWCCTRADSVLVRRLLRDRHCAFEVSADLPPYRGVRGRGKAWASRPTS